MHMALKMQCTIGKGKGKLVIPHNWVMKDVPILADLPIGNTRGRELMEF